jgi:hypothetical protein
MSGVLPAGTPFFLKFAEDKQLSDHYYMIDLKGISF